MVDPFTSRHSRAARGADPLDVVAHERPVLLGAQTLLDQPGGRRQRELDRLAAQRVDRRLALTPQLLARPIDQLLLLGPRLLEHLLPHPLTRLARVGQDLLRLLPRLGELAPLLLEDPLSLLAVPSSLVQNGLDPLLTRVGVAQDLRERELRQQREQSQEDDERPERDVRAQLEHVRLGAGLCRVLQDHSQEVHRSTLDSGSGPAVRRARPAPLPLRQIRNAITRAQSAAPSLSAARMIEAVWIARAPPG